MPLLSDGGKLKIRHGPDQHRKSLILYLQNNDSSTDMAEASKCKTLSSNPRMAKK
jgi:hypothetical protein